MKFTINLKRDQINDLKLYLQKKYSSKASIETLVRVYLLQFIAAESSKDAEVALENIFKKHAPI